MPWQDLVVAEEVYRRGRRLLEPFGNPLLQALGVDRSAAERHLRPMKFILTYSTSRGWRTTTIEYRTGAESFAEPVEAPLTRPLILV